MHRPHHPDRQPPAENIATLAALQAALSGVASA